MRTPSTLVALLIATGTLSAESADELLRRRLERAGQPARLEVAGRPLQANEALPSFYERRGFALAWSEGGRPLPRATEFLAVVREVGRDGLRPDDYHAGALGEIFAARRWDADRRVDADLLLTDAFLMLAAHTVSGRVDPRTFDPEWVAVRREVDVIAELDRVAGGDSPRAAIDALKPRHEGYRRLVAALERLRERAEAPFVPVGPGPVLKPGMSGPRVERLRARLGVRGEDAALFDAPLEEAVRAFQRRMGLNDDGAVGPKTQEALDLSLARRIRTVELNLERWRWLPQDLGDRYLLVNIPEFRLEVVEGGRTALELRVIVGRSARRTPVFSDRMRYLVFSPSWEVPPTILRNDKIPEMRRDPEYAKKNRMRVFQKRDGAWVEVEPTAVDWAAANAGNTRLRQQPGPDNALGLVKFMFPNPFNVYLHDTPTRNLFDQAERDFSSGCIRVQDPIELANYLLRDDPNWDREGILRAMEAGTERTVMLPQPLPVHIQYWTAWVDAAGELQFRRDLYGRDAKLDAALRLPPPEEPEP